jgi:hypothetical protein
MNVLGAKKHPHLASPHSSRGVGVARTALKKVAKGQRRDFSLPRSKTQKSAHSTLVFEWPRQ